MLILQGLLVSKVWRPNIKCFADWDGADMTCTNRLKASITISTTYLCYDYHLYCCGLQVYFKTLCAVVCVSGAGAWAEGPTVGGSHQGPADLAARAAQCHERRCLAVSAARVSELKGDSQRSCLDYEWSFPGVTVALVTLDESWIVRLKQGFWQSSRPW